MPRAPERSRKESSHAIERAQIFRMIHSPDRPLKGVSHRDIPREADCRRIILDWKTGKEKPPIMRSRRTSRNLEKATECMNGIRLELEKTEYRGNYEKQNLRRRRGFQAELPLNPTWTAEDGLRYRILPEPQYVSQQTLLPKTTYTPQSMTTTTKSSADASTSPMSSPIVYTSPSTQSSSRQPRGLCNSCKAEFTMSTSSFYEDDESILHSSACFPHVNHLASKARCEYSGSVYSLDTSSTDDRKLTVSPVLLDDADDAISSMPSCSIIGDASALRRNSRRGTVEEEQVDLYDLDWADYYFDQDNFALDNGTRGEPG
ncbi:hypothetical protein V8C34DRAFT_316584 [Trichoderma compactum]